MVEIKTGNLFAIVALIIIVTYINGAFAYAYNFVGDTNIYPEGTDCTSDIIKEESEDYENYKEKTKWWDED